MLGHFTDNDATLKLTKVDAYDDTGLNALLTAVRSMNHDQVEALALRGAHPNVRSRTGMTPLYIAVNQNSLAMVNTVIRAFVDSGDYTRFRAGIDLPDLVGGTALLNACHNGNASIVRLLLKNGANPNLRYGMDDTVLFLTANNKQPLPVVKKRKVDFVEVARLLLAHGADPTLCGTRQITPLMMAAKSGFTDMVALLLSPPSSSSSSQTLPVDVNAQDAKGLTALHYGVDHADIVDLLLRHGADPSIATIHSPTHVAAATRENA